MLISLNWLKKYVDLSDASTDELVDLIGSRLVEVEEVIDLSEKYKGIKIVEVMSAEKIKGSDHLTLCQINTGAKDLIQVVCGAPNVKTGMLAAWLAPGVVLPETYNKEPLILDKRKIMGVESAGMLAAMDELDLGSDHAGIIEINPETTWIPDRVRNDKRKVQPGDSFAEVFELNDIILDIENKSLTHRPDCFGVIGFAREVAGVLGQKFVEPNVFASVAKQSSQNNHMDRHDNKSSRDDTKLEVEIVDSKLCPRYSAAVLSNVNEKSSKYLNQMQVDLAKSGVRSIDKIVDITNYLMLLTGQPLHAFDYDKLLKVGGLRNAKIIVRGAKKGEELKLLDGKVVKCDEKDILITSNDKPIALAGAMGGVNTAIDENTKRIVIESATFSLFNIRGTQFRHGIFSEAVTRFTKGQPEGLTMPVLNEAISMLDGKVETIKDCFPMPIKIKPIDLEIEKVNMTLGTDYDFNDMVLTLENVGFETKLKEDYLQVTSPWWRTDILISEDVIEEIGRLQGYDNISLTLPTRKFEAPTPAKLSSLKNKIRDSFVSMGANELLTYSFVSESLLTKVGQDSKNSYKIINSISPELQYVRQQLAPSLLEKAYENQKAGYEKFALFEMNQVFRKNEGLTKENVPIVFNNIAFVLASKNEQVDFYDAKKYLASLGKELGIEFSFRLEEKLSQDEAYFTPKRSASVWVNNTQVGIIGELSSNVKKNLKLSENIVAYELDLELLFDNSQTKTTITKQSNFQNVKRDITFRINSELEYIKLENLVRKVLEKQGLWFELQPASIWQGEDLKTKNISFNLTFASFEKTLKSNEIADIMDSIVSEVKKELKGELV